MLPTLDPLIFHWYDGVSPAKVVVVVNVTSTPLHEAVPVADDTDMVGVSNAKTDMVIALLLTVALDGHASLEVISQATTSPCTSELDVYVVLLVPTLVPFNFHWYTGETPPNCGVAVNVTEDPVQMVFPVFVAIETTGVTVGFTLIVAEPVCGVLQETLDAL